MVADPPGGVELVGRLSRRSKTGRETLPVVRKTSGDPPGGPEDVGRPFRSFVISGETLSKVRN